jgi:PLP dependent protein
MNNIAQRLAQIKQQIADYAQQYQRTEEIRLLAVSKTHPKDKILQAVAQGQIAFGENYVQPALVKIAQLQHLPLEWHFIGTIQTNKTRAIAENFAWVQSLDQIKHAVRLNEQRPAHLPALNICIQVNIDAEIQKSGVDLNQLTELIQAVQQLPRLKLRGLMAIPAENSDFAQQCHTYGRLYTAFMQFKPKIADFDTLSMGMSQDIQAAISQGSTMLRIGSGIFGPRINS